MGKIVKYCSSCDEGFAEKFGFCPTCGTSLQAFEMNPVEAEVIPDRTAAEPIAAETFAAPDIAEAWSQPELVATPVADAPITVESTPVPYKPDAAAPSPDVAPHVPKTVAVAASPSVFAHTKAVDADYVPTALEAEREAYTSAGGFYVTVIEEKNVKQRNVLLLATLGFMIVAVMAGTVYSLFAKDLSVGAIGGDDIFVANLLDNVPMVTEEEKKKDKDDGGGGGGGGREDKEEVNKGDLADQTPNPIRPPDAKIPRLENPSLVLPPPSTQGNMRFDKKYDVYGDPNGRFSDLSNGPGTGGGMGSGRGTGQGSGNGSGAGSGNGSGFGNGNGNGNGDGDGDGDRGIGAPPPRPVGVTQGLKIISKPKPPYTDGARQAVIQGTVILRVTFLASGQIGNISAVKGLPNGLTESAIAAARRISFEPKKIDGVGQNVTRQVEYTFSIY